jgi:hypothetical protein
MAVMRDADQWQILFQTAKTAPPTDVPGMIGDERAHFQKAVAAREL